jgi:hypothetical protein
VRHSALPIAILTAAIGWLCAARVDGLRGFAKWAPAAGRSLRQRVDRTGNALDTANNQVARKKLSTEPMAGYGA